jgi:phage-related tail fiber protein
MTDIPGAAYKATCRVASTANITTLSGLLTIDGIVLVANDRVLVKDQTASQNNGI